MRTTGRDSTSGLRLRLRVSAAIFALGLAAALGRAVYLQFGMGERLMQEARNQYQRDLPLAPRRGAIVDAVGTPLAVSLETDSLFVDPRTARKPPENPRDKPPVDAAGLDALAQALSLEPELVSSRFAGDVGFAWLKRRMSPEESAAVSRLGLKGLGTKTEFKRFYPQQRLASHLLGSVGIDNEGLEGLEQQLDDLLRGEQRVMSGIRDVRGRMLLSEEAAQARQPAGAGVQLTVHAGLQLAAEKALAAAVEQYRPLGAMVIVMEPETGAILALANQPDFDPNQPGGPVSQRRNLAVVNQYEPGSTMKCFLMAAGLSERLITPETVFDIGGGAMQIGKRRIRDSHPPRQSNVTTTQILATSSNVGCARVGLKLGADRLIRWYRDFGFGERTGLGIAGEARGSLQRPASMKEIGTATTSFGQGVAASPLQLVTALSAIANGGKLMKPYLVARVTAEDGTVLQEAKPTIVRQVLTPEVARQTTRMMQAVVEPGGTGTSAAVPGYSVAGKTGTAQKADPVTHGYGDKRYGSFMGFVPADKPRFAIYVALDEPHGQVYGGVIAAPVFQKVAAAALQLYSVPPDRPVVTAAAAAPVKSAAPEQERDTRFDEGYVAEEGELSEDGSEPSLTVPDLRGLSARAVRRLLGERSLEAALEGSGRVVGQDPSAGALVPPGSRVQVRLGGE